MTTYIARKGGQNSAVDSAWKLTALPRPSSLWEGAPHLSKNPHTLLSAFNASNIVPPQASYLYLPHKI